MIIEWRSGKDVRVINRRIAWSTVSTFVWSHWGNERSLIQDIRFSSRDLSPWYQKSHSNMLPGASIIIGALYVGTYNRDIMNYFNTSSTDKLWTEKKILLWFFRRCTSYNNNNNNNVVVVPQFTSVSVVLQNYASFNLPGSSYSSFCRNLSNSTAGVNYYHILHSNL